jgi:DNA-binding beta-propeller fold protein YncE
MKTTDSNPTPMLRRIKNLGAALLLSLLFGCGGGGGGGGGGPNFALLAGNMGGSGHEDGSGAAVQLARPRGLTMGSDNNLYLTGGERSDYAVRTITLAGVASTIAGAPRSQQTGAKTGHSVDGAAAAAQFSPQFGVVRDGAGNLYTAGTKSHTIRRITPAGVVSTLAGTAGTAGNANGTGTAATFNQPHGLAIDSSGTNLYVADKTNNTIRRIVIATGVVTTLAGSGAAGNADGTGLTATFNQPHGLVIDSSGTNLYVATRNGNNIRRIVIATGVVTTLAGSTAGTAGNADGIGTAATFSTPTGITIDSSGTNLYVAAQGGNNIRRIVIATGVVTTLAGSTTGVAGNANGTGTAATFNHPGGLAIDSSGTNLYVADGRNNHSIRQIVIATGVVTTFTGSPRVRGRADGTGSAATFNHTKGVVHDSAGNVYVADGFNNTIRKVTPAGVVTTLAGSPTGAAGNADGTGPAATFSLPMGLAIDSSGTNLYVAALSGNNIRKIVIATGAVTTLAGSTAGTAGNADGTGTAATFSGPKGLAIDSNGTNLYVAARNGNNIRRIVIATGAVTTLAGSTAGTAGHADGTGTAALFSAPGGIAIDSSGTNLYVADGGSSTTSSTIRRIVIATGVVTTLAGTAGVFGHADGTGAAATFNRPEGLTIDSAGNLIVVDRRNNTIRKVTPAGVVTTVAGTVGVRGFTTNTLPAPRFASLSGNTLYLSARNGVMTVNLP